MFAECLIKGRQQVCVQIYSGSMEREFVPVDKRGGGQAKDDSHLPAHLRNSFPHTNSEATVTAGAL